MNKQLLIGLLFMPAWALADVNMRTGAFTQDLNEFRIPVLTKTYNSRSLWNGNFGFGWCAYHERKLKVLSKSEGLLQICDREFQIPIHPRQNTWTHKTALGFETYNAHGQLISLGSTKLFYEPNGHLSKVQTKRETIQFEYNSSGLISRAVSNRSRLASYEYNDSNLIQVHFQTSTLKMSYDDAHNLTRIQSPQRTESIQYDSNADEIRSVQQSDNPCEFHFQFQKTSSTELKSTIERKCPSSPVTQKIYSFHIQPTLHGNELLSVRVSGGFNDKSSLP